MTISLENTGGSRGSVTCAAVLDLGYAPELKELLLQASAPGGDVDVHAEAVTNVDTANLQVLCAAARDLARAGRALRLIDPSPVLLRIAQRLGLTTALGLTSSSDVITPGAAPPGLASKEQ